MTKISANSETHTETIERSALGLIAEAIEKVNAESGYGSIEVTIHDSRRTRYANRAARKSESD